MRITTIKTKQHEKNNYFNQLYHIIYRLQKK